MHPTFTGSFLSSPAATGLPAVAAVLLAGSATAQVINLPGDTLPAPGATGVIQISAGVVNLNAGGALVGPAIFSADSTLNVNGGTASRGTSGPATSGSLAFLDDAQLNVSSGTVTGLVDVRGNAQLTLTGGTIGNDLEFSDNARGFISGGSIGTGGFFNGNSVVDITGGQIGEDFAGADNAVINVSGGQLPEEFLLLNNSTLSLTGSSFFLDGVSIDGLSAGGSLDLAQRGGEVLSGVLSDGSAFSFGLNLTPTDPDAPFNFDNDLAEIASSATVRVNLVPEPTTAGLLALGAMGLMARRRRA